MDSPKTLVQRLLYVLRTSPTAGPALLAVTIGGGAGLASVLFRRLIGLSEHLFHDELGSRLASWTGALYTIPMIALGGLLVGLITKYFAPETKGHGVPEVMNAVAYQGGRIRARVTIFKALAAALCIGSGGSAGREGPIVQIGSAFGSALGQWIRLPDRQVILSVACGAAGGVAATFNAPMAGVLFAMEVILNRFTALSFGLVVMSSATATVVAHALSAEGDKPAFAILGEYRLHGLLDLVLFLALGICCGVVAALYTRILYAVEDGSDRVRIPEFLKPAIGGALVGAVAIWTPQVMGTGYDVIEAALNNQMLVGTLFLLCLAKLACTALSIGSGGSGGIFAPALFIGAMFGGGFGSLLHSAFPGQTSPAGAYALVGMAAVFSGAAHAPVTAIFILFEMTDNYGIIVPLMSATVVATFVSQQLVRDSIYTLKLKRRGLHIGEPSEVDIMEGITVAEAMEEHVEAVPPNLPVPALIEKLERDHETGYPVIDLDKRLVGMVTMRDVEEAMLVRDIENLAVADICTRNVIVCRPEQSLSRALAQFGAKNVGRLPVIDPHQPDRLVGMLTRGKIVAAYAEACQRSHDITPKADALASLRQRHAMVVEEAEVTAGSDLAGVLVRNARFPKDAVLGAIFRANHAVIPSGSTRLEAGDELFVLTTRDRAANVRAWLAERK